MSSNLGVRFQEWLDTALARKISRRVVAFNFNLYEGEDSFHVDLIGAPSYDPKDSAWACDEIFAARDPVFEIPRSRDIKTWRKALSVAVKLVREYLRRANPKSARLKHARAVTVGFVDGDLVHIWPPAA